MTEERKIQIPVVVDGSGAKAGFDDVKQGARDMAQAVSQAGVQASTGVDAIGVSAQKTSATMEVTQRKFEASIKRNMELQQALLAGPRGSSGFIEARAAQSGADVGALKPMLDQLRAVEAAQKGATTAVVAGAAGLNTLGMSAKQTAFALRGVPAQFTDIATSLASGQKPMLVLLQQGGQLKDMFGGIGPAARALGGYILGLVNPFTIGAAVIGGVAYAANAGSKELREFQNAATISGNAIGLSISGYAKLRDSLAGIAGSKGKASEVLTEIASSGITASQNIKGIAEAAILMEKATGQAVGKTIEMFSKLADEPSRAALELNKSTNFLTAALYGQIRALEELGRKSQAAEVAERALAETLKTRAQGVVDNAGLMERAWRGVAGAAKLAWDTMLNVGRAQTPAEQLAELEGKIARARGPFDPSAFGGNAELRAQLPVLQEQARLLRAKMNAEQGYAEAVAETSRVQAAGVSAVDAVLKVNERAASKQEQLNKALKDYRDNIEKIRAADPNSALLDPKKIAAAEAGIRKQFEDKGAASAANALRKATLGFDIEKIKADGERAVAAFALSERELEAMRAVGMVSEQEYFDGKRALIEADSQARQSSLKETISALQEEARVKELTGVDLANNQKEVVKLQSDLAEVRSKATLKQVDLSKQEVQAADKVKRAYEDAAVAAASYIATIQRNAAREFSGIGTGSQARADSAGRYAIDDRFLAEQQRLERDLRNRAISQEQFDGYLAIAKFTYGQEVKAYEERTARMQAVAMDWANGAREALANYADEAENISKQTEAAVGNAFQGMEDALVNFAMTGKLSFKDLANSIIADLTRIFIKQQITGPLANYLGGMFTGGASLAGAGGGAGNYNFGGGFAKGGVFQTPGLSAHSNRIVNKPTVFAFAKGAGLMGEAGPEAIMPLKRGPDGRLGVEAGGGGGGNTYHFHNNFTVGDVATISTVRTEMDANNRRLMGALDRRDRYGRG